MVYGLILSILSHRPNVGKKTLRGTLPGLWQSYYISEISQCRRQNIFKQGVSQKRPARVQTNLNIQKYLFSFPNEFICFMKCELYKVKKTRNEKWEARVVAFIRRISNIDKHLLHSSYSYSKSPQFSEATTHCVKRK